MMAHLEMALKVLLYTALLPLRLHRMALCMAKVTMHLAMRQMAVQVMLQHQLLASEVQLLPVAEQRQLGAASRRLEKPRDKNQHPKTARSWRMSSCRIRKALLQVLSVASQEGVQLARQANRLLLLRRAGLLGQVPRGQVVTVLLSQVALVQGQHGGEQLNVC